MFFVSSCVCSVVAYLECIVMDEKCTLVGYLKTKLNSENKLIVLYGSGNTPYLARYDSKKHISGLLLIYAWTVKLISKSDPAPRNP